MLIGREDAADAGFGAVGGVGGGGPALPIRQRGAGAVSPAMRCSTWARCWPIRSLTCGHGACPGIADGQDGADLGQA